MSIAEKTKIYQLMTESEAYEDKEAEVDRGFATVTDRRGLKRDKTMAICRAFHNRDDLAMRALATGKRLAAYNQVRIAEQAFVRAFG